MTEPVEVKSMQGRAVAVFEVTNGTRFYLYRSEDGQSGWVVYQPSYAREYLYFLPGSEGPWQEVFDRFLHVAGYRPVRALA